jgi:uncharacterized protein YrzB (UPF0473 family)
MSKMADDQKNNQSDEYITLVDAEGNEELYQILLTFESDEFDKSYVLVYPAGADEDEEVEIFAFSYDDPDEGLEGQLDDIETDEEWDMIEEVLGAFIAEDEEE